VSATSGDGTPARGVTVDELIGNALAAVADEMLAGLIRAAYSPNIKERADCSTSVFAADGQTVALASSAPLHLGALAGMVQAIGQRIRRDGVDDGDVWIGNDPYVCGGTHLNDIAVVAPVVHEGQVVAFLANLAHHADVGGRTPGSESGDNTSIFQDGLRLPPMKLADAGRLRQDILDLVLLNSRTPDERIGDLRAQLAALHVGRRRLGEVAERYGRWTLATSMAALLDATEARFRASVRAVPDGVYRAEDFLDDDGLCSGPVRIAVTVSVAGDRIAFDFGDTDPQVPSGKNMAPGGLDATVYYALKALVDPGLADNSGYFRAVSIACPEGSLLRPRPPAAVGSRALTGMILADVIFSALAPAVPERAMARSGPYQGVIFSGVDPGTGRFYVDYENFAGGTGARRHADGADCMQVHITNTSNLPIEAFEGEFPLTIERFELIADSGGPGRHRGGLGVRRDFRVGAGARLSLRSARQRFAAGGVEGGEPGGLGAFRVTGADGVARDLPSTATEAPLSAGDLVTVLTPGGGGFGDALDREPSRVLADVLDGRVSMESAAARYGVVVRDAAVDGAATQSLRASRRTPPRSGA
jgi:N-methylhydantoinase B